MTTHTIMMIRWNEFLIDHVKGLLAVIGTR